MKWPSEVTEEARRLANGASNLSREVPKHSATWAALRRAEIELEFAASQIVRDRKYE